MSEVRQRARERRAAEAAEASAQEQSEVSARETERAAEEQEAAEAGYELGEKRLDDLQEFDDLSEDLTRLMDEEADWNYLLNITPGELPVGDSDLIQDVLEQAKREEGVANYSEIARRFLRAELDVIQSSIDGIKHAGVDIAAVRQAKEIEDLIKERFTVEAIAESAA